MSSGAIYADMYGRGGIPFGQSTQVIWQQGDPDRANAIADALDARPWVDYEAHPNEYLHLTIRNGATSRYSLYQYMNIEGTHLGEGGTSLNNGSISSTFCAYAYALGGPPMIPFRYGHAETVDAANRMWQNVYDQCRGQHSAWEWFWISLFGGCYVETACSNAAAQVINCFATPDSCGNNSNFFWMAWLDPDNAAAYTISPDYLGGQGRFASLFPTTWSRDTNHMLYWNAAGYVCGCFQ